MEPFTGRRLSHCPLRAPSTPGALLSRRTSYDLEASLGPLPSGPLFLLASSKGDWMTPFKEDTPPGSVTCDLMRSLLIRTSVVLMTKGILMRLLEETTARAEAGQTSDTRGPAGVLGTETAAEPDPSQRALYLHGNYASGLQQMAPRSHQAEQPGTRQQEPLPRQPWVPCAETSRASQPCCWCGCRKPSVHQPTHPCGPDAASDSLLQAERDNFLSRA